MKSILFPKISLILNVLVLIPVCFGILLNSNWAIVSYGIDSTARGILLAIYTTILLFSILLLLKFDVKFVVALLSVQVIYKLLSPIMVGSITNPVIISNLFIAFFHVLSLIKIAAIKK